MFSREAIESAQRLVAAAFAPTPQQRWPLLDRRVGAQVWVKHENHSPVGAFKLRGGLTYFDALCRREPRCSGVVSATRGNHGQSVGYAARRHGLGALLAPLRPSWKERYPLTSIERYARWTREDGLPFDPWIRTHVRLGGEILRPEPRSMRISGTVAEWEEWTRMAFPESGDYWFPGCLTMVTIDRKADRGSYWEPNVWMRHGV